MAWDERSARMLAEMGIRLWQGAGAASAPAMDMGAERTAAPAGVRPDPAAARAVAPPVTGAAVGDGAAMEGASSTPAGVVRMDWPALRAAVAGCTACGLCQGRTQTVFGVGHTSAQWMIVGEAPGEQEDRQGEPFVGKAGQLLDNMLRALGLGRGGPGGSAPAPSAGDAAREVYIANVLKCRPPMNRNPLPQEVAQCEPYLKRQVALVRPRVILAMGRFAVQSLLRSDLPIGRLRGRLHAYEGVPLVVTYHPAYLLRNPADKALAWDDLCLARTAAQAGADR
jgi:DNA polymerase